MTDIDPYIRSLVDGIISAKLNASRVPAGASLSEVVDRVSEDVRSSMNRLAMSADYELHHDINKRPFITRRNELHS